MAKRRFFSPPQTWTTGTLQSISDAIRKVVLPIVASILRGKLNNTYDVTLAVAPATTTTLQTEIASADSIALFTPKTASAATTVGAGNIRAACADGGVVTFTHDSNAATDRTFGVAIFG